MLPSASFLVAAVLLAVIPGPGIAYVVARTVSGGKSEGIASSMGAAVGVEQSGHTAAGPLVGCSKG